LACKIIPNSEKNVKLYTGYTKNFELRFEQEEKGKVGSTKNHRSFKLIYYESNLIQADELKREMYLKTYYDKMFLKKLLKSYFTGLAGGSIILA